MHDEVKSFTEDIEASYETRKAAVADLAKETHQTLDHFKRERKKMAGELKRSFVAHRAQRISQVQKLRARNGKDLKDMTGELKKMAQKVPVFLSASEKERKLEFATLIKEIKSVVASIEEETTKTLGDFRSERKGATKALRASLESETKERIEIVREMLSHFAKAHEEMADSLRSELLAFQRN